MEKIIISILALLLLGCLNDTNKNCENKRNDLIEKIQNLKQKDNELIGVLIQAEWLSEESKMLDISGIKTANTILNSTINSLKESINSNKSDCKSSDTEITVKKLKYMTKYVQEKINLIENLSEDFERNLLLNLCSGESCMNQYSEKYYEQSKKIEAKLNVESSQ